MTFHKVGLAATSTMLLSAIALAAISGQTDQTLREMARGQGGRIKVTVDSTVPMAPLASVASEAELIVQGRIIKAEPRLSEDERAVVTHFAVIPTRIFKNAAGAGVTEKPGPTTPITFVQPGGTVRVDGLEITYESSSAASPPLGVGEEVIVFLARKTGADTFRLHSAAFGLLRVQDGKVSAANKEVERRRPLEDERIEHVQRTIEQLIRTKG